MINRPITSLLGSAVPMAQEQFGYTPTQMMAGSAVPLVQQQLGYTRQPPMMNVPVPRIQTPSGLGSLLAPAPQQKPSMLSGLLSGPGSSARYGALAKALTQNSATPMSFGQRLTGGLLAGSDAAAAQQQAAFERSLREREMALNAEKVRLQELELTGKISRPDYITVKAPDGSEVLVDKKTGDILNPFGDSTYGVTPEPIEPIDYNPSEKDIYGAGKVSLENLAGGNIGGYFSDAANVAAEFLGTAADPSRIKAKAILNKVNTPIVTALAADLGKTGSKYIVQKAEQNVPTASDGKATFYNKSISLISSLENKKEYAQSVLRAASATKTEKADARKVLSTVDDAIKFYSDIVSEFEEEMKPKFPNKTGTNRRAAMRAARNTNQNEEQKYDFSNMESDQMKSALGID